jgi:hypothetical protein
VGTPVVVGDLPDPEAVAEVRDRRCRIGDLVELPVWVRFARSTAR